MYGLFITVFKALRLFSKWSLRVFYTFLKHAAVGRFGGFLVFLV